MKKIITALSSAACLVCATSASATVVSVGHLSSDSVTKITTDTLTGRQYSRFDAFDTTYAGTLAAIAPSGAWAGWSIASSAVSDQFIAAALGVSNTPCDGDNYGPRCGIIQNWTDGKLGASFNETIDYYGYLSATPNRAGIVSIPASGDIGDSPAAVAMTFVDGFTGRTPVNYLLYRDVPVAVPEPVSLALLGLGLAGLVSAQRLRGKRPGKGVA